MDDREMKILGIGAILGMLLAPIAFFAGTFVMHTAQHYSMNFIVIVLLTIAAVFAIWVFIGERKSDTKSLRIRHAIVIPFDTAEERDAYHEDARKCFYAATGVDPIMMTARMRKGTFETYTILSLAYWRDIFRLERVITKRTD